MTRKQLAIAPLLGLAMVLSGCMTTEMDVMKNQLDQIEYKVLRLETTMPKDLAANRERLEQINRKLEQTGQVVRESGDAIKPEVTSISEQIQRIGRQVEADHQSVAEQKRRLDNLEVTLANRVETASGNADAARQEAAAVKKEVADLRGVVNGLHLRMDALDKQMNRLLQAIGQVTGGYDGETYTVQTGDTLSGIAAKTGVTVKALMDANGIDNPNMLTVGQTLRVPK